MDPNSTLAGLNFAVGAMNRSLNRSNYEWSGLERGRCIVPSFNTLNEELDVGFVHTDVKYTDETDTAEENRLQLASLAVEVCFIFALILVHFLGIRVASKFALLFVRTKSMYHFTLCRTQICRNDI